MARRQQQRAARGATPSDGCQVLILQAHVVIGRVVQLLDLAVAEQAHELRRVAQPQLALADHLARRDQRTGADEPVLLHHRAVEHAGMHADQAVIADAACVHDRGVADGDAFADQAGEARAIGAGVGYVHDAAILDAGAGTDANVVDVTTKHRAGPD